MRIDPLPVPGSFEVGSTAFGDDRGWFLRSYCGEHFEAAGLSTHWPQINISLTARSGTIRGMHFQRDPAAEAKFVRCISGEAFDVLIDLRSDSGAFGRCASVILSAERRNAVYVPEGCAHGFQALTDGCMLLYMHSHPYSPENEAGVNALDPELGIEWPLPTVARSARDTALPCLGKVDPL